MFKKRSRNPNARIRQAEDSAASGSEQTPDPVKSDDDEQGDEETKLGLDDIIALRKYRRANRGIDAVKLTVGDTKRKKVVVPDEEAKKAAAGLRQPTLGETLEGGGLEDADPEDEEAMTRKLVRSNNFTQQTNVLDVDKHMMEYIEKEIQRKRGDDGKTEPAKPQGPYDPYEELFRIDPKYKLKSKTEEEEGNVTSSMAMLTAIPEVDLGMETRLRNIEETEKAKRQVADMKGPKKRKNDDDDLASTRFSRRTVEEQSPAVALMNARLEAQGFAPTPPTREPHREPQQASDEKVMERFKKRMRK